MQLSKESIVKLLETNDKAVARALVVLNERQTRDEQVSENTKYLNGEGFRPCHARMGTSMATFYLKRGYLTPKQIAYWRKADKSGAMGIGIYWKQLIEAAQAKAATPKQNTGSYAATAAASAGLVRVNGEFEKAPVDDVGNMSEEVMILQEMLDDVRTAGMQAALATNDDRVIGTCQGTIEGLEERIALLRKEIVRAVQEGGVA